MKILETERLVLREITADDAEFVLELLNTPKFIKYIGDRGVRSVSEAANFIENRYRQSYRDHGYGLYTVEARDQPLALVRAGSTQPVGICGFVRRPHLPAPDIGFAFLPQFEGRGYGFESAAAAMQYGGETLAFDRVLAITSLDNDASIKLLEKLGFVFDKLIDSPEGDKIRLFSYNFAH